MKINNDGSIHSTTQEAPDFYVATDGGFGINCDGRVIIGGGYGKRFLGLDFKAHKVVNTFHNNNFFPMKQLNIGRAYSSAVYIPPNAHIIEGMLMVAGGQEDGGSTLEYLRMNSNYQNNDWIMCKDKLPCEVSNHQMNILRGKLILTGGYVDGRGNSNKVWEGVISYNKEIRVKWNPLPDMNVGRQGHCSVVMNDTLYCLGGCDNKTTENYSFTNNVWQSGHELPFTLNGARAVLNEKDQCFLVGGYRDGERSKSINMFDPIKGIINVQGELFIGRCDHIAVLL